MDHHVTRNGDRPGQDVPSADGLEDKRKGDQSVVYEEFLEQLSRSPEGWYETGLPWKGDHPLLPSNKSGSLKRLGSLVQRLKKTGRLDDYDAIMQEQLNEGIIEEAEMPATQREFYISHKAVVRECRNYQDADCLRRLSKSV